MKFNPITTPLGGAETPAEGFHRVQVGVLKPHLHILSINLLLGFVKGVQKEENNSIWGLYESNRIRSCKLLSNQKVSPK